MTTPAAPPPKAPAAAPASPPPPPGPFPASFDVADFAAKSFAADMGAMLDKALSEEASRGQPVPTGHDLDIIQAGFLLAPVLASMHGITSGTLIIGASDIAIRSGDRVVAGPNDPGAIVKAKIARELAAKAKARPKVIDPKAPKPASSAAPATLQKPVERSPAAPLLVKHPPPATSTVAAPAAPPTQRPTTPPPGPKSGKGKSS